MIYLDYAANTPVEETVLETFCDLSRTFIGNPNSEHLMGEEAKEKMDSILSSMAGLLKVLPQELIFTSGASESNNLAIKGIAQEGRHRGRHILSTCLEHSSVSGTLTYLQNHGYEIEYVDIQPDGTLDLEHLKELLRSDTILLAITAVDSELGTIQPIEEISAILKGYPGCGFHIDATQAIGKIPFSFKEPDTVSFTPHKFYGLNGCGVLWKDKDITLEPMIHGGISTTRYRSGTPALALAGSIDTALSLAINHQKERFEYVETLNQELRRFFSEYPAVRINSSNKAVPFILNISVKGVRGTEFQKKLSQNQICVSVKSACSSGELPSKPVMAVTRDKNNAMSSWRISLSHLTTLEEIDRFKQIFKLCYKETGL